MSTDRNEDSGRAPDVSLGRRELLAYTAAFGTAFLAGQGLVKPAAAEDKQPTESRPAKARPRRYEMKKSINMWALPYPDKLSLKECFALIKDAGFDGVEINFALEGEFSAESSPQQIKEIAELARRTGIAISGVCSFLFWPYSMTHNDPDRRKKGIQLARQMIEAARLLGTENLLVVPGAVYAPWLEGFDPVPNDVCDQRAREAVRTLIPEAEKAGVSINIEHREHLRQRVPVQPAGDGRVRR
jgi:L-ribulose-5-phosphate 3-epimerase